MYVMNRVIYTYRACSLVQEVYKISSMPVHAMDHNNESEHHDWLIIQGHRISHTCSALLV